MTVVVVLWTWRWCFRLPKATHLNKCLSDITRLNNLLVICQGGCFQFWKKWQSYRMPSISATFTNIMHLCLSFTWRKLLQVCELADYTCENNQSNTLIQRKQRSTLWWYMGLIELIKASISNNNHIFNVSGLQRKMYNI